MAPNAKLLVIGIDAANGKLLRQWASEGALPNLGALMRHGRTATLRGVDGFFTGATWPSLLTSSTPATHGIHYLAQLIPGTYRFARPHEGAYVRAPMFWEALTNAEKRLAILDVPLTKLDPSIRGLQTVEWAGHDSLFGFKTSPPELAREVLHKHGAHPVPSDCDTIGLAQDAIGHFIQTLIQGVEAKKRLTKALVSRGNFDLFMQVFTESHCVGHQCWHLHDADHPSHDQAMVSALGDPIRRVYTAIDTALGEIISAAGNPPVLVVVSHGMSHAIGTHLLLPEILQRLGLMVPLPAQRRRTGPMDVIRAIVRRVPASLQNMGKRWLEKAARPGSFGLPKLLADTSASRCFVVPNGLLISGIRMNLAGREPEGMVQPGEDADALYRNLAADLLEIRDARTHAPLVRRVLRTADVYQGKYLDCLPDILVEWHDEIAVGSITLTRGQNATMRAHSAKIGVVEAVNKYRRTGEHRSEGLLIAAGPGIEAGRPDLSLSILDVAPTITASLGVTMETAAGRAVAELIPTRLEPA